MYICVYVHFGTCFYPCNFSLCVCVCVLDSGIIMCVPEWYVWQGLLSVLLIKLVPNCEEKWRRKRKDKTRTVEDKRQGKEEIDTRREEEKRERWAKRS